METSIRAAVSAGAVVVAMALGAAPARADGAGGGAAPPAYPPSTYESKSWTTPPPGAPSWRPGDPATTPDPRSAAVVAATPAWTPVTSDPAALSATVPPGAAPCAPPCAPADPVRCGWGFEAWARYWRVRPSGTTFITKGGEPGTATTIDLDSDLSTDDGDGWQVGVGVRYGRHRGFLSYEALSFSGSAVLDRPVVFHAATYPQGEHVDSTLDLDFVRLGYDYAWKSTPTFVSRVGVSGWLWDFEQKLKGTDSGIDESRGFSHVLPVAHLSADGTFGWAHLGATAAGGLLASDRYAIDLEARAGVRLGRAVTIDLGWRWMKFVFHETTNEADMEFTGPFAALTVVF